MNRILRWLFLKPPLYKAMDNKNKKTNTCLREEKYFILETIKMEKIYKKNKLKEGTHFDSGISILSKTTEEDINYF